jgi:hypothetical protein
MGGLNLSLLAHAVFRFEDASVVDDLNVMPGSPVTLVEHGDLALLASRLTAERAEELFAVPEAAADVAVAHHRLLTTLALRRDLAPIRLGAVYGDEKSARTMLELEGDKFRAALDRVSGAAEYALKMVPGATSAPVEPPPPATGRAFLQRRGAEAAARRNAGDFARAAANSAFGDLARHARAHVFLPPRRHATADQEKRMLDAALLVPRSEADRFGIAVIAAQSQAARVGYVLSVAGPLPPYSFMDAEAA